MIFDTNELARAVLFFDEDGHVFTEMHIAEFQAVLDGFVPLRHMAGLDAKACYVEFDSSFHVRRLAFFMFPLDGNGEVNRSWHVPLMDLAASAPKGKDMGAGPVRLACYSQCPIAHVRARLWDPDLSPASSHLNKIKQVIADNKLGVQFTEPEGSADANAFSAQDRAKLEQELSLRLRREYAQEFRDHMAQLLKEQRLRISTSKSEAEKVHHQTKLDYEKRVDEYKTLVSDKDRLLDEQRAINRSLKETVDGQADKISAMREYFDLKLESAGDMSAENEELMRSSIEAELRARFESESKELKEQLQMREVELLYRNELEVQLHDEVARLREENQRALVNTGDQLLEKLVQSGISFVSFHPGAGHLTVPTVDIGRYIESPTAYAAEKCNVTESAYTHWLEHYRMPVCSYELEPGKLCGENIDRIEAPIDFKVGENNLCEQCQKKKARSHLKVASS